MAILRRNWLTLKNIFAYGCRYDCVEFFKKSQHYYQLLMQASPCFTVP